MRDELYISDRQCKMLLIALHKSIIEKFIKVISQNILLLKEFLVFAIHDAHLHFSSIRVMF